MQIYTFAHLGSMWTNLELQKKPKPPLVKCTQYKILRCYAHLQVSTHDQITMCNQEYCCHVIQHIDLPQIKIIFQENIMWALGDIIAYQTRHW
jgi:hypothetical protein